MTTYTGQSLRRREDHLLVQGRGSFVDDMTLPDMLHAAVLRSPHAHARIISLDVTAAKDMPGVATVFTSNDIVNAVKDIHPRPWARIEDMKAPEHPVLAKGKVCYVGQPVAVVVAEDRYLAKDALDLIEVEYDPLTPVVDPFEAAQGDSPAIHEVIGNNVALRIHEGPSDVLSTFAGAACVVRQRFDVPRLSAVPMEGRAMLAHYQSEEQTLTLWTSTQGPHTVKSYLSELLNLPLDSVRVIAPDVGGGFGQKIEVWPEEMTISYLAIRLGRPVKWVEDRMENLLAQHGRGMAADVEAAARSDGTILGVRFRIVADLGAYFLLATASAPNNVAHRVAGPYDIPQMEVECLGVITNKPPTGPYRGAGGPEAAFFMERTMDLVARELNIDPVEVRRRNFIPPDAFPYTTATGLTYDSGSFAAATAKALDLADYDGWRKKQRIQDRQEPLIGVGLATVVKASGGLGQARTSNALVRIDPTGQVSVFTEISPHGQGTETAFAQFAADALGVSVEDIQILHGDTEMLPSGQGTFASRGLAVGGSTVYLAAREARKKVAVIAAHLLNCLPEEIEIRGGTAFNKRDPEQAMAFSEVASAAHQPDQIPEGIEPGLEFPVSYTLPGNPFGFAAHVVVVEVNQGTGEIHFLRYAAVHDCGRLINPMIVEGQIHGAIAQGIGEALGEGMVYSPEGQPLTSSLMEYALPTAEDMPTMILDMAETPSPTNPLEIKGIGELPTVAAPVAIANAVMDALSGTKVGHLDLPLTPEKVWRALQEKHP